MFCCQATMILVNKSYFVPIHSKSTESSLELFKYIIVLCKCSKWVFYLPQGRSKLLLWE